MKILITATSMRPDSDLPALEKLRLFCDNLIFSPLQRPLQPEELIPLVQGCEGYIAGLDYVDARVIEAGDRLQVISRNGAGVDRIDLEAAKGRGIVVCNTPGANAQAVADLAMGLALSVARRIPMLHSSTVQGGWKRSTGIELYGKTMGIMGLGAVGRAVARRAKGFSMRVLAYDPFMDHTYAEQNDITAAGYQQVLSEADVLSLHLPLTDETRHILDRQAMQTMKTGAIIINTARGGLIDESAAADLLLAGHLGGLGIDVFEKEPPESSPLFALENVVVTPHTAAHTQEAVQNMTDMAVDNLICVLQGRPCPNTL